jgi:hypothetical protein
MAPVCVVGSCDLMCTSLFNDTLEPCMTTLALLHSTQYGES